VLVVRRKPRPIRVVRAKRGRVVIVRKKKVEPRPVRVVRKGRLKPLPPSGVWEGQARFLNECRRLNGATLRGYLKEQHVLLFNRRPPKGADPDLVRIRIAYELQYRGYRDAGCLDLLPKTVWERRRASKTYDRDAFDPRLRQLLECKHLIQEDGAMAARKRTSRKAPQRKSAASKKGKRKVSDTAPAATETTVPTEEAAPAAVEATKSKPARKKASKRTAKPAAKKAPRKAARKAAKSAKVAKKKAPVKKRVKAKIKPPARKKIARKAAAKKVTKKRAVKKAARKVAKVARKKKAAVKAPTRKVPSTMPKRHPKMKAVKATPTRVARKRKAGKVSKVKTTQRSVPTKKVMKRKMKKARGHRTINPNSIGQLVINILRRKHVPNNQTIINEVLGAHPDAKFDSRQLSWYKYNFRAGNLPGMTKGEDFNQPDPGPRLRGLGRALHERDEKRKIKLKRKVIHTRDADEDVETPRKPKRIILIRRSA